MMKKLLYLLPVLLHLMILQEAQAGTPGASNTAGSGPAGKLHMPLLFTENKGQVKDKAGKARPDILFTTHSGNTQVFLCSTGLYYQFTQTTYPAGYDPIRGWTGTDDKTGQQATSRTHLFSLELEGAAAHPVIRKEDKNVYTENFYTADAPEGGISNVGTYGRVVYENVYPHIDWVVYSRGQHLKYDFIVHPGGDPSHIRLKVKDAGKVSITPEGELLMETSLGAVKEKAPSSSVNGKAVQSSFKQNNDGTIGFDVAAVPGKTLVIDPAVEWATYYGAASEEIATACATDASGNVFLTGQTTSTAGIAIAGGYQTTMVGGNDAFLVKFNTSGTPLWATYFGGSNSSGSSNDINTTVAPDNAGNVYLCGVTNSTTGVATPGAYHTTLGGGNDIFLAKFSTTGALQWATYYGGPSQESNGGCTVDASGNIYINGSTLSVTGISSPGAFQTAKSGLADFFLAKFNPSGALQWSTYYGGSGAETIPASAPFAQTSCVDNTGNISFAGFSTSSGLATVGQTVPGGNGDVLLAKFNPSGNQVWSTYFGGSEAENASIGCCIDAANNIYMTTTSASAGLATSGAYQGTSAGFEDAVLAKFSGSGIVQWATYYGGSASDAGFSCALDAWGNIVMAGYTLSPDGIATGAAFQTAFAGGIDGFAAKFNPTGSLLWGSYFGGPGNDLIYSCATDNAGYTYLAGQTASTSGIASPGAYKPTYGGDSNDGFLAKVRCSTDTLTETQTICSSQLPYTWHGITLTAGGSNVASDTLMNAEGCDSIVHLNLVVSTAVTPVVTITVSPNDTVCAGTSVTFTAAATNGGTAPAYQWLNNNSAVGTNSATYTTSTLTNNNAISVKLTSNAGCMTSNTDTSNVITMTVNPVVTPAVTITVSPNDTVCAGTPVTFTAITVNGGGAAGYQWKNGVTPVGTNSATYTDNTPATGDVITVMLSSSVSCASPASIVSNEIHIVALTPVLDTVTQQICTNQLPYTWYGNILTTGGNAVATHTFPSAAGCDSTVTLNLVVSNTSATTDMVSICAYQLPYVWNGITVTAGGPAAAIDTLTNSAGCDSIVTLNLTVNPVTTPTINITAVPGTTINIGTPVVFTAAVTNGGSSPVLQWRKNGINVGTNSTTYTDLNVDSADIITCILVSNAPCAYPDSVFSNEIEMTVIIPPPPCLVPLTLVSTDVQLTTAIFKWAKVTGASGYEMVLDRQAGDPVSGLFTTDTAYHASALLPGLNYFHIRTRCTSGEYSPWITIRINILDATGIAGPDGSDAQLMLYPNPSEGLFYVSGTVPGNEVALDVVDRAGRRIYQRDLQTPGGKLLQEVRLPAGTAKGLYLLRLVSENQVTAVRFVIR